MNPDDENEINNDTDEDGTVWDKIIPYKPKYHRNQLKIFYEDQHKIKIIAKGRRFGLTKGMAKYVIQKLLYRAG